MQILGIDVGGSGIKAAPVDIGSGTLAADRLRIPTPSPATPKAVIKVIRTQIEHFEWDGPVGVAFPARVKHGVVRTATNISKRFIGMPFADELKKKTGLPTRVVNDADAAGVAEMLHGAGKGLTDLVLVLTVGTGIGSALFINQTLVPNTEFGHVDVRGVVGEVYASDRTRKEKSLSWAKWSRRFQRYLDRLEFLVAPDLIIVGGGVSKPERAREFMPLLKADAELTTAQLGNEAGIVGAAIYAADPTIA